MIRAFPLVGRLIAPSPARPRHSPALRVSARRALRAALLALVLPSLVLALWCVAVRLGLMRPQILPSPLVVAQTAVALAGGGDLASALLVSLQRVVIGLAIGGSCGLAIGAAMGRSRTLDAFVGPTVRAVCQVPTIAWLPIFMLLFGIGEPLKLAIIAKASFLPMLLNSYAGMRAAPARYLEVAATLELGRWQRLRYVLLPAALPYVAGGLRLALSNAWHVLIVVEMVASAAGIGHLMAWSRTLFQLDAVFVTIVVIGATGWLMDTGMRRLEHGLMPWSRAS